MIDAIK